MDDKVNQQRSKKLAKRKTKDSTYSKKHVRRWETLVEKGLSVKRDTEKPKQKIRKGKLAILSISFSISFSIININLFITWISSATHH